MKDFKQINEDFLDDEIIVRKQDSSDIIVNDIEETTIDDSMLSYSDYDFLILFDVKDASQYNVEHIASVIYEYFDSSLLISEHSPVLISTGDEKMYPQYCRNRFKEFSWEDTLFFSIAFNTYSRNQLKPYGMKYVDAKRLFFQVYNMTGKIQKEVSYYHLYISEGKRLKFWQRTGNGILLYQEIRKDLRKVQEKKKPEEKDYYGLHTTAKFICCLSNNDFSSIFLKDVATYDYRKVRHIVTENELRLNEDFLDSVAITGNDSSALKKKLTDEMDVQDVTWDIHEMLDKTKDMMIQVAWYDLYGDFRSENEVYVIGDKLNYAMR